MALTPAEPSRPGRKWSGSRFGVEGPFWSGVVVLLFIASLIMLAESSLEVSRILSSGESDSVSSLLLPLAGCVVWAMIVVALLIAFGRHPRTRSDSATASFRMMKALMLLAGIVLFAGGALQMIKTEEFAEQVALALLSIFYVVTPMILRVIAK